MAHSEAEKKKAAKYIEEHLGPETRKGGVIADEDSGAVTGSRNAPSTVSAGSLRGWEVRTGLDSRLEEWHRHLEQLTTRLTGELNGLRQANILLQGNELDTSARFSGINNNFHSPISDFAPPSPPGPYAPTHQPYPTRSPISDF
ncbi:hypothetical protein JJV70_05240 [Streptomyces sp. JJ66]|uniref:hypothetical protein n=1 Tax=Streptomyces sp. JJ66 TaxID=2803843 RepID=UPI001C598456|nr:hypothetical protein [Streptomyces sp. JJ66]MBW1601521.1 hypothetical protein [Streptomyces sp. JJ66]